MVVWYFWYFWLTIQNTTIPQVRNLFSVIAVFISFSPWRATAAAALAAAPPPHPAPLFWGEGSTKKKIACSVGDRV